MPRRHQKDKNNSKFYRSSLVLQRLNVAFKAPFRREDIMTKLKINSRSLGQRDEWKRTRVATDEKYESALKKFKEAKHLDPTFADAPKQIASAMTLINKAQKKQIYSQ